jgi:hypothetical protein
MSDMARHIDERSEPAEARAGLEARSQRRAILFLSTGTFALLGLAGGLLWWRDGERLFTEGLISAIARCF